MFAKINHVAIVSENYALIGKFYESVFGMKPSETKNPARALTVGDGYVGLNINPRKAGRPAGLDHFGIQVEDVETAFDRMRTQISRQPTGCSGPRRARSPASPPTIPTATCSTSRRRT